MMRRELLTLLGAGATGVMVGGVAKADDDHDKKDPKHGDKKHEEHHEHMKVMAECAAICNKVAAHSLEALKKGGEQCEQQARVACATNDCQAFCVLTVTLMARDSLMASHAHKACADACRDCATVCEKSTDEKVKKCAEICRECERLCRAACEKPAA